MRLVVVVAVLLFGPALAAAQPVDPYAGEAPAGPPPGVDEIDETVAIALVERARVLEVEGAHAEARQLVIEALARRPGARTEADAKALLGLLDRKLGLVVDPPPAPPPEPEIAPPGPRRAVPSEDLEDPPLDKPFTSGRAAMAGYGFVAGSLFGAGAAGFEEGSVTVGASIALGAVGALAGAALAKRAKLDRAGAHVIGTGVVWGAAIGGMFADVASGLEDTTEDDIGIGVGVGALAGGLLGASLRKAELTVDDAALINSVSAWTALAGLQLAVAIDPVEDEGYTLNGALGASAGYVIGHVAARNREVSSSRLARVNGLALLGAAIPWGVWLLAHEDNADDAQPFGWLSIAGLGAGIYFGFRWTREPPPSSGVDDAPVAVVRRSSAGAWSVGAPAIAPVRGPHDSRGAAVTLLGGAW